MTFRKNLARQRAAQFGQPTQPNEEADLAANSCSSQLYTSPSSSVLVSTTSDASPSLESKTREGADFLLKPRGFFADQFEVGEVRIHKSRERNTILSEQE